MLRRLWHFGSELFILFSLLLAAACGGGSQQAVKNSAAKIAVYVHGDQAEITPGTTCTFTASVYNTSDTRVKWSVTAGTITGDGLFTPPETEAKKVVDVMAASFTDPTAVGKLSVAVSPRLPPTILYFRPADTSITPPQTTTLQWHVHNATRVEIDQIGKVQAEGMRAVAPTTTTVYSLTASSRGGTASAKTTVMVSPLLSTITPNVGSIDGGDTVLLAGSNFQSGATVSFGEFAASSITEISGLAIRATTPPHGPGAVDVTVTNPDGQNSVLVSGFNYLGDHSLQVAVSGSGTVSSSPAGINSCSGTCAAQFQEGQVVTLTALADSPAIFLGWGGECLGIGVCSLSTQKTMSVTANFTSRDVRGPYDIMKQEPATLVPYPNAFTAKKLPHAGAGGPTDHLMNNEQNILTSLYNARWIGYGWIAVRFPKYPSTEGAAQAKYYGRQDASCTATEIANHLVTSTKVCDPSYKVANSNMRDSSGNWSCYNEIFHAPSGAYYSDYGAPPTQYDHEIHIWDQNTDKAFAFYTYNTTNAALPACPDGTHAGTDADPCPFNGLSNYCGTSNGTTGRLEKPGNEGRVWGSGNVESNDIAPLAVSESYAERLSGHINHALYINTKCVGTAGGAHPAYYVFPSIGGTAGKCDAATAANRPPNGALFFLDYTNAELDCLNPAKPSCSGTSKVHPMQFTYIEALSYYGAYVGDTGSSGTISISRGEIGDAYAYYHSHGYSGALTDTTRSMYAKFFAWFDPQCSLDWCDKGRLGLPDNDYIVKIANNVPTVNGRTIFQRSHFADPCVARALAGTSPDHGACY